MNFLLVIIIMIKTAGLDHAVVGEKGHSLRFFGGAGSASRHLRRKLLSCSQSQELSQRAVLAPNWLHKIEQPIRSQLYLLTELLTLTTTQKFPSLGLVGEEGGDVDLGVTGRPHARVQQQGLVLEQVQRHLG